MRARFQLQAARAGAAPRPAAAAPAPVRGPVALAAERAAASGAANAGASNQAANRFDPVHTAVKPPSAKKMPDPASIPGVKLLGTIDLPVTLASGSTPLSLNTRLQRSGCPFGVRWLDVSTKDSFTMERTEQAKKHFNWYNFFTSDGGKPRYMKLRPVFRPDEPGARSKIPLRILVVDGTGKVAPEHIAFEIDRDAQVKHITECVRAHFSIPEDEKVVLANVRVKLPQVEDRLKPAVLHDENISHKYHAHITKVYTSRDGDNGKKYYDECKRDRHGVYDPSRKFESDPAKSVTGFYRDFKSAGFPTPKRSPYDCQKFSPDGTEESDFLVAYRVPANATNLAIVYPSYHMGMKSIRERAASSSTRKEAIVKEHEASVKRRKALREQWMAQREWNRAGYDSDDYYDGYSDSESNNYDYNEIYHQEGDDDVSLKLKLDQIRSKVGIMPLSIPIIMGAHPSNQGTKLTGGEAPAAQIARDVKKVLEQCVLKPDAAADAGKDANGVISKIMDTITGKKRSRDVASTSAPCNLPDPTLMHSSADSRSASMYSHFADMSCESVNFVFNGEPVDENYAKARRGESNLSYSLANREKELTKGGYKMHHVLALFDIDALNSEVKDALKKLPHGILPSGARKHVSAELDEKANTDIVKAQYAEACAMTRSIRIQEELDYASMTSYETIRPPSRRDAYGGVVRAGPDKWKLHHPLVRLASKFKPVAGKTQNQTGPAILEVKVYVKDENYKRPADEATARQYWYGAEAWLCSSFVRTSELQDFSSLGMYQAVPSLWSYGGGYDRAQKIEPAAIMHETIATLFWGKNLATKQALWDRMSVDAGEVRAIPDFMQRLELPELPAATQPQGLSVDLRDYQLQSLRRMLELEAAPRGLARYDVDAPSWVDRRRESRDVLADASRRPVGEVRPAAPQRRVSVRRDGFGKDRRSPGARAQQSGSRELGRERRSRRDVVQLPDRAARGS